MKTSIKIYDVMETINHDCFIMHMTGVDCTRASALKQAEEYSQYIASVWGVELTTFSIAATSCSATFKVDEQTLPCFRKFVVSIKGIILSWY